jgi:acetyl-CoA C-acetyltransferase
MNAVMEVDQAAAVVMTSAQAARALGIPEERWVYWCGGAETLEECWYPSERPDFSRCQALREAGTGALAEAGIELGDLAQIDFYSCFPVAVEMACEMLGLDEGDPRGFTVTGGLPYAGGPGNNYTLHALATMAERVGAEPGAKGLVTGNGWYLTKHSATLVSSAPGEADRWPAPASSPRAPELLGVDRPGSTQAEVAYGLGYPASIYPIFENALRARRGLDLETHRERLGGMMSRFTEVAARNPYAWFPTVRSAEEIATPSPRNRMIAFPYTKYMNAVMEVDQAAAVLMTSAQAARALGIPEERWVYWFGGAETMEERWYPSERLDFSRCQALREAGTSALAEAGVELGDLAHIDFYSCFPVAVEMACEMLGLGEGDPRGFTVTGGLPYAGGPGNNYTLHALATMAERVRAEPGATGLVTGNGWYLTKHTATVVSSAPREGDDWLAPVASAQAPEAPTTTSSTDPAEGRATLETYTVLYDRDGAPERGIVLGRTAEGRRFVANTPEDRALLEAFVATEQIGREGALRQEEGRNVFDPA